LPAPARSGVRQIMKQNSPRGKQILFEIAGLVGLFCFTTASRFGSAEILKKEFLGP
jgi:hypothetical protein